MSESAAAAPAGGFTQSRNQLTGLTNVDLRARRRKKRVMDTSLQHGNANMSDTVGKVFNEAIDRLNKSIAEIISSAADNRDELLTKSVGEFAEHVQTEIFAGPYEPLAKGLNHISTFANVLVQLERSISAITTGRPSYMVGDDYGDPEKCPEHIADAMDAFLAAGKMVLHMMVEDSVELPMTDEEATKAQQTGELVKIEGVGGELLIKTALPDSMFDLLTHPIELAAEAADVAGLFRALALSKIAPLAEHDLLPPEFPDTYPELFEEPPELGKAFGRQKPQGQVGTASGTADPSGAGGASPDTDPDDGMGDGSGGMDDGTDDGTGAGAGAGDGTTQDPIELIARCGAAIVAIASNLLQSGGQQDDPNAGDPAGSPADMGLQRAEILGSLRKAVPPAVQPQQTPPAAEPGPSENEAALAKQLAVLTDRLAKLEGQPAPAKGVTFAVPKSDDMGGGADASTLEKIQQIAQKAVDRGDPDAAAAALIRGAHMSGGHPEIGRG